MPRGCAGSTLAGMDPEIVTPLTFVEHVYMVEAYRGDGPVVDGPDQVAAPAGTAVLGVIDVPSDEVALFLISAPDAPTAERVVRDRGMQPIRVVPAEWGRAVLEPT